jgi:hypothetical protein
MAHMDPDITRSPVLALRWNMLSQVENLKNDVEGSLRAEVDTGLVWPEIQLSMDDTPPRGPHLLARSDGVPEVHLDVPFLEMLWAFIYSWMVFYEEGVHRPMLPGTSLPTGPTPEDLIDRACSLREWSKSLATGYTRWPQYLPSPMPDSYANEAERYFGEKANLVFQLAVALIFNHERAHAVFKHLNINVEVREQALQLQLEKEADTYAIDRVLRRGLSDGEKSAEAWAIVSTVLATFYAARDPRFALRTGIHPALHHRAAHFIRSLGLEGETYRHYFAFLARLVLQDLFPSVLPVREKFEDAEDALSDALDRLDAAVQSGFPDTH